MVLEDPADSSNSAPPSTAPMDDAQDAPHSSPVQVQTEDPKVEVPPSKKAKVSKGKAPVSQGSLPSRETFRCKYSTRHSQGISSAPIDVDSYSSGLSASKFFSELISAQDCDRLLNLPPDRQQHQAADHFAQVILISMFMFSRYFCYLI